MSPVRSRPSSRRPNWWTIAATTGSPTPPRAAPWLTSPAGRLDLVDPARFQPHGRIVFAGSDVAEQHAGWFEGALASAANAARELAARLDGEPARGV